MTFARHLLCGGLPSTTLLNLLRPIRQKRHHQILPSLLEHTSATESLNAAAKHFDPKVQAACGLLFRELWSDAVGSFPVPRGHAIVFHHSLCFRVRFALQILCKDAGLRMWVPTARRVSNSCLQLKVDTLARES